MAEVIVSAVAEQLIDIINEQIQNEIHLVRGVDKEVLNLADELKTLRNVLDDAENRRFQDKEINHWLSRLEQTAYKMEDVLDEWNYVVLKLKRAVVAPPKHKVCSFIPSSRLCFKRVVVRRDIAKKIKNVNEQLGQILREKDRYNFVMSMPITERLPEFWRVQSTSLFDSAKIHGRDRDTEILVGKLMDNSGRREESGIHILSIVGMGGLGKTTLAQLVYNHSQVELYFDIRIWICVSDPFDLVAITKGILESIENRSAPNTNQLDALLKHVKEVITGKKFLLVLDDVWTEDLSKWEPLENSLRCGGVGSKILVTTRNERVVKMMGTMESDICRLGLLSDEDCWLLLCRMALFGRNEVGFEDISKKIAEKCNGLPLAAKTLGSLLRFKTSVEEWETVLNSEIWKMEEAEVDIFPHLLLSYKELSPTLKRCFSYCAVFPKDSEIDVERLIGNWMALGYLGSNISDMEVKGRECFNVLAKRSLFQEFKIDNDLGEKIISCKMHDIVHDFANFIRNNIGRAEGARMNKKTCQSCDPLFFSTVNEFCSLFWDDKLSPPSLCDCLARLRVLSMTKCGLQSIPQGMKNLIHLRWLDLSYNTLSLENLKIIFQLYYLQTLGLSNCSLEEIPGEIENLIQLRHLNLSKNMSLKELPSEIGNLIHLKHLDLSWNESLEELPESICSLHELRTLDIESCCSLSKIPEGVAQLSGLRTLGDFRGGSSCSKLRLLNKLNHLGGSLRLFIRIGGDAGVVEDAWEAELRNKMHIKRLVIAFEDVIQAENEEECRVSMDVMDALEPHPNLQKLRIINYKGSKLPWLSPLNQLRRIDLCECNRMPSLPPLGRLPCLEEIVIDKLGGLEIVGREFLGMHDTVIAFPKLKKLAFWGCPKWNEWEEDEEEEEHSTIMPCLVHLAIVECPSLTSLPRYLLHKASALKEFFLFGSMKLQQHCRDSGVVI